jgi:hypothetical protein
MVVGVLSSVALGDSPRLKVILHQSLPPPPFFFFYTRIRSAIAGRISLYCVWLEVKEEHCQIKQAPKIQTPTLDWRADLVKHRRESKKRKGTRQRSKCAPAIVHIYPVRGWENTGKLP